MLWSKSEYSPPVYLESLQPGSTFLVVGPNGREGTLIRNGTGSSLVRYNESKRRTFTPETGPNAGKEITFTEPCETTTISLKTEVYLCRAG
jgi:hypothetical protein